MYKIFIVLFTCMTGLFAPAQDGDHWSISHHQQQLLSADKEDPEHNIITLTVNELKQGDDFHIAFNESRSSQHKGKWIRTIALYTAGDSVLYRNDSSSVTITGMELKKMLTANGTIMIYTWALPKDPALAASVRVRRLHLCTIKLI